MLRRSLVSLSLVFASFAVAQATLQSPCMGAPSSPTEHYAEVDVRTVIDEPARDLVLLVDNDDQRLLTVVVGNREGEAISQRLDGQRFFRPLTHDLLFDVVKGLHATVTHVQIDRLEDGVFYGSIWLQREGGEHFAVDARPSDAMALALAEGAPIYAHVDVLRHAAHRIPSDVER